MVVISDDHDEVSATQLMQAWLTLHTDPLAGPELIDAIDDDVNLSMTAHRNPPVLILAWLAAIGLQMHPLDSWTVDVVGRYNGRAIGPSNRMDLAGRRPSEPTLPDGAWWLPGTRGIDVLMPDFGLGDTDFCDVDMSDSTLGRRVRATTWMPMTDTQPLLLLAVLHPHSLSTAARIIRALTIPTDRGELSTPAASIWAVARWMACRITVTTGQPPAQVWASALDTAIDICGNADYRIRSVCTTIANLMADRATT